MRASDPAPESIDLPAFADVVAAHDRLAGRVLRTPVAQCERFDARVGRRVAFKCEQLQRGGAFKLRGALNALLQRPAGAPAAVATHSSGNHGTALAIAARSLGLEAHVVVPEDASPAKVAAVERAGGRIVRCAPGIAAREAALAALIARQAAHVVHPFDDSRVIAGQGTAALELLCDEPGLVAIVVPVGGGGLVGGTALAARGLAPGCRVIGVEPAAADDARRSFVSGVRQPGGTPGTIADGLRAGLGMRNFELLRRHVDDVVTVTEEEIVAALRVMLEDARMLIEPSSAVAVAAVIAGRAGRPGERIGVILSGGNVELGRCPFLRGERLDGAA